MESSAKIQRFFASDKLLRGAVIVFCVLLAVNIAAKAVLGLYTLCLSDLCFLLCVVFLYRAFRRHNKNVQKGLLGAVLMWYFCDEMSYVLSNIVFDPEAFSRYDNFAGKGYLLLSIITLVLYIPLFINHFSLSGDHKSKPAGVKAELWLGIVLSLVSLVSIVFQCPVVYPSAGGIVESVTWHTALVAFLTVVGSYEAHMEQWKEQREVAE